VSEPSEAPTQPPASSPGSINRPPVQYKGEDLDSERGPGLGCFRFQLVVLAILVILTPISVVAGWPELVSAVLLFVVIGLLLLTGQTMIFLMRLVAADRRSRRRPMASATRTVGELEDAGAEAQPAADGSALGEAPPEEPGLGDREPVGSEPAPPEPPDHPAGSDGVRQ
jgi:hypothetical protein